jgi:ADP-heptose:LPS heptosyltransferase
VSPNLLVARLDNAGDVLLAGPSIRAAASSGKVTVLCGPAGAEAARLLPGVDDVWTFDAPWVPLDARVFDRDAVDALLTRLAESPVDEAAVLTSAHQSPLPLALLLRLAGVPRIGAVSDDHPGTLLDVRLRGTDDRPTATPTVGALHEVERSVALLREMGHRLPAGDDGRLAVRHDRLGPPLDVDPYVVVHPGASVPARGIEPARAAAAVSALVDDGWHVAVTGARGERELTAEVAGDPHPLVTDLGGALDLAGLAGVLRGAAAAVSGNTGPGHLAAAVGTPVVSVFAPVVPAVQWAPWGVPVVVLGDQTIECAGCRCRTCPLPGQPCLDPATPEAVVAAVRHLAGSGSDPGGRAVADLRSAGPGSRPAPGVEVRS